MATTKKTNDAADIKATVKDILNAGDKAEASVKKAAAASTKKTAATTEKKPAAAAPKKTETKAAAPKKTETKPAAAAPKKAAAPKVIIQIWGNDIDVADIVAKADEVYKSNSKKKNVKELYIKPEEGKAYYVADDDSGSVDLW